MHFHKFYLKFGQFLLVLKGSKLEEVEGKEEEHLRGLNIQHEIMDLKRKLDNDKINIQDLQTFYYQKDNLRDNGIQQILNIAIDYATYRSKLPAEKLLQRDKSKSVVKPESLKPKIS